MFRRAGEPSVTLQCKHDDNQHLNMFWYRQIKGGKLELIAYSFGKDTTNIEAPFTQSKYSMSRPELLKSSLEIKTVDAADSAVYYCASSRAQWFRKPQQLNNNLKRKPGGEDEEQERTRKVDELNSERNCELFSDQHQSDTKIEKKPC